MTSSSISRLALTPEHYALLAVADRAESFTEARPRISTRMLTLQAAYLLFGNERALTREESEANHERMYSFVVDLEQAGYLAPHDNHIGAPVSEITDAGRQAVRDADISSIPYELSFDLILDQPGISRAQIEAIVDELRAAAQQKINELLDQKATKFFHEG